MTIELNVEQNSEVVQMNGEHNLPSNIEDTVHFGDCIAAPPAPGEPGWDDYVSQMSADAVAASTAAEREILLNPRSPMQNARVFLTKAARFGFILIRWQGVFYRWEQTNYSPLTADEIKSRAWLFLDKAVIPVFDKKGVQIGTAPFNPNLVAVSNFIAALEAETYVPDALVEPGWIRNKPTGLDVADIIPVQNGLYHIPTGVLHPHTPDFFCLNASAVTFDSSAPRPARWLQFLDEALPGDRQAHNALQETFGYGLSSDISQHKIFFFKGAPRAGKGTVLRVLSALLGKGNVASPTLTSLSETFGLASFIGKMAAIFSDAAIGTRIDSEAISEVLKSISGEDEKDVARKYKDAWHGTLRTRLYFAANALLKLIDKSSALASRLIIIEFNQSFLGKEDKELTPRLLSELPGIFNWAMEGRRRLTERGHFIQPESGSDSVNEMAALGAEIRYFVDERCDLVPGMPTPTQVLYIEYQAWCLKAGVRNVKADFQFSQDLVDAYHELRRSRPTYPDGKRYPSILGIVLKNSNASSG